MHNFGLPQRTIDEMTDIFVRHRKVDRVVVYGSRAMGNYRRGSDIDLTLFGERLEYGDLTRIAGALDDSSIPYMVDVSIFEDISNTKLRDHIERVGKVFYDRYSQWKAMPFAQCLDSVKTPAKLPKKEYLKEGKYPVVAQEAELINGFCNDENMVFHIPSPLIVFGDHTQVLKYIDFDFVVGADGTKLLKTKPGIEPKFFFYQLYLLMPSSTGYARHYRLLKELTFNIPPLDEQKHIVARLDAAFAEIDAAIEAVKKQQAEIERLKNAALQAELNPNPAKWKTAKLGDICEVARGGSPRPIKEFITHKKDGINWIKISDAEVGSKYIHSTKEKIIPQGIKKSRFVKEGEFLLSNSMSFGRPYILKTSGCIHDGWLVLSPKNKKEIDKNYFYYFLSSSDVGRQLHHMARGSIVKNLNTDIIKKLGIALPPLAEQRRIAVKLDKISAEAKTAAEAARQKQANYESLKSAILAQELQGETQ